MQRILALLMIALPLALGATPAHADSKTDQKLVESRRVFESFANLSEQAIPTWLLERSYGVVVVPDLIKGALGIGGRGGRGVMAVRNPDGTWSNPVFVTLAGVNFGFQFGVQSTDIVMVLMSRQSVEGIADGKVTLGADASVAAGPIGRAAAAQTDAGLKAQVLSYSRNEGIFAGVALDGTVIAVDNGYNESAYGVSNILASQILEGRIADPPPTAVEFRTALERATGAGTAGAPAATPARPASAASPSAPAAAPDPASAPATTYPMEDENPGAPPPE